MGIEKIKRITIKKDGVYLYSKSANDDMPYHSFLCKGLSEVYAAEGQEGLDREVCRMFAEYAEPTPTNFVYHQSVLPYVVAGRTLEWEALTEAFQDHKAAHFARLSEADKECVRKWYATKAEDRTERAKAHMDYQQTLRERLYADRAKLVAKARKKLG